MGEVVITDLNNYCMPFIRYRIGDLAVAMDQSAVCRCGRGLPRIGRIEGRVQSLIVTADGRYLPGSFFPHFFKDYDYAVHQYQVVQESASRLRLKIVKAMRFDEVTFATILKRLRPFVGERMQIEVEFVDHIPMVRTGKVHGSISNLGFDFQKLHAETTA
jgi:phenylacetate-CoA ligase